MGTSPGFPAHAKEGAANRLPLLPVRPPGEIYASKYIWNSYGCGRIRNGSTSFSYL